MELLKVADILLSKYQLHTFTVIVYYAFMQFKLNKRIEVQIAKCDGRFNLQELKLDMLRKPNVTAANDAAVKEFVKNDREERNVNGVKAL